MRYIYFALAIICCSTYQASAQFKIVNTTTTGAGSTVTAAPAGGTTNVILGGTAGTGGSNNTLVGDKAGNASTAGTNNTFIGQGSGSTNVTGQYNTYTGSASGGNSGSAASYNTFSGYAAGKNNQANGNSFFGNQAGHDNTTGGSNAFFGSSSGRFNIAGQLNAFFGFGAGFGNYADSNSFFGGMSGYNNSTGKWNVFLGASSGQMNTTGEGNTFAGLRSGFKNTASYNCFFGYQNGESNENGWYNTYYGARAGRANVSAGYNSLFGVVAGMNNTADSNSFFGAMSGHTNTSGKWNTFLGASSGQLNNTGNANTFAGYRSGHKNTASNNSFFGAQSGTGNTSGDKNSFFGTGAGQINSIGALNTFMGYHSGYNTFGNSNTFIGHEAGKTNTSGHYNTVLGSNADVALSNLDYATALGYGAIVDGFNAMVLGGTDLASPRTDVNVGIGTRSPAANLHMEANTKETRMWINTTKNDELSTIDLRAGTPDHVGGDHNDLVLLQNAPATVGIAGKVGIPGIYPQALPPYLSAPLLPWANLAMVASKQSPLYIGTLQTQTENYAQNIHFVTGIDTASSGPAKLTPWECLRINKSNGFVGVHTRNAISAGATGDPQALFHVNLTQPGRKLDPFINGIRFEGLPDAPHPEVIVIDVDGNLAKRPYPTGPGGSGSCLDTLCYWTLMGNTINSINFIGSKNAEDFRMRTNNVPRGRITKDGDWDFGTNSFVSTGIPSDVSGALGTNNTIINSPNAFTTGRTNRITNASNHSGAIGQQNILDDAMNSFAAGSNNVILSNTGSKGGSIALGSDNHIENSNESVVAGEANIMKDCHGCFIGGGHDTTIGMYNVTIGDRLRTQGNTLHAYGNSITNDLSHSIAMGFRGTRTLVLDDTGVAIKLDWLSASTYKPTVNFEVQAGVAPPMTPQPMGPKRSNIRFHNLPDADDRYPSVVIDPATGELFMSNATYPPQFKMSIDQSGKMLRPVTNALEVIEKIEPKKTEAGTSSQSNAYGITASNMESVLPNSVGNINLAGKDGRTAAIKGVNYDELIPLLVQAVKDQQSQIKAQQSQIDELMAVVTNKALPTIDIALSDKDAIRLDQSVPNPADRFTSIGYYIPSTVNTAVIKFADAEGKLIKSITIAERGAGKVNIYLSELSTGVYTYTLIADGQLINTKKMVVTR
jgi:hypothetical protein